MASFAISTVSTAHHSRVRTWAPKVKTGCVTCKARHIKCSEGKPVCKQCQVSGRKCQYVACPKAWTFELSRPANETKTVLPWADNAFTVHKTSDEQRAFLFFREKTVLVACSFEQKRSDFWTTLVPQAAETQEAIRHMVIALAARHEQVEGTSIEPLKLSHLRHKHYVSSLVALNKGGASLNEEVLLVASCLYILYGNLEEPENQNADDMMHLTASVKILTERNLAGNPPNHTIDRFLRPMIPRLEMMYSTFMMPSSGLAGIDCQVEPRKPDLSKTFSTILEAREKFFQLCCWRWRLTARLQPWITDSEDFKATKKMFLRWYNLMLTYAAQPQNQSAIEHQRVMTVISQFRLLFVTMVYSARQDLHSPVLLRPTHVKLIQPNCVSLTYHLTNRWLGLVTALDWEKETYQDPLETRLFPLTEVAQQNGESGMIQLTYRI